MDSDLTEVAGSAPVVLLGRGGGGTRLLSEMVQSLGFFFGNDINQSQDSVEWVEPIYQLVRDTYPIDDILRTETLGVSAGLLRKTASDILRFGGVDPSGDWGWKLPETTLLVGQVVAAFPNARFIQLTRHPVTACCRRTHMTSRLTSPIGAQSLRAAYKHIKRPLELLETDPEHIWNAASWAHQADVIEKVIQSSGVSANAMSVRFEDICADSFSVAESICEFLNISLEKIGELPVIDPDRLNALASDQGAASEVWDICHRQAVRLGYPRPDQFG